MTSTVIIKWSFLLKVTTAPIMCQARNRRAPRGGAKTLVLARGCEARAKARAMGITLALDTSYYLHSWFLTLYS
jgi:hypothetical protein